MKKTFIRLGLTLIFLIVMVACSNNNAVLNRNVAENEVTKAPVVKEDEPTEHNMDMNEHVTEPAVGAEVSPTKPTDAGQPAVVEPAAVEPNKETTKPEVVEPKQEATKPEVVEPKEQPAVEVKEPMAVEPKEPEVVEPSPVAVAPTTHKVDIVNFAFSPESLEISVGDIVEFTNLDATKHSAVEDNGVFDTGLLGKGESKSITFSEAGEFAYYCGPHPRMRAKIVVK